MSGSAILDPETERFGDPSEDGDIDRVDDPTLRKDAQSDTATSQSPPGSKSGNDPPILAADAAKPEVPRTALASALEQVTHAAYEAGIRREHVEGAFVSALMAAMAETGRVSEATEARLTRVAEASQAHLWQAAEDGRAALAKMVEEGLARLEALFKQQREAAKLELERAQQTTTAASRAVSLARQSVITSEIDQGTVVARMVDRAMPAFTASVRAELGAAALQAHGERQRWRHVVAGLVVVAVGLGTYALSRWQDRDAIGALAECLSHPLVAQGRYYCDIARFRPAEPPSEQPSR